MTLCVPGFSNAEARNNSMISVNKEDLFRYLDFHLVQSVPAGALLQSSTTSMSLGSTSVCPHYTLRKSCQNLRSCFQ